jgi:hypothetical protein
MEFLHASIALLASMVLVLAGMIGWLYWQQTRLFQNMNSIVMVIGELARPPPAVIPEETEVEPTTTETAPVPIPEPETPEDDRVSVEKEPVSTETDTDDLEGKTKKELADILTKKGIPFSKSDNKNALISLLKATA